MHPFMLSQLVDDRKDELAADARRAHQRQQPRRRPRADAADETLSRREWRALLRMLQLAR
jgi:hypothetical protein